MPAIITRSCNNFGPRQFPEKAIPVFILSALAGKPLPVYAQGKNRRDWIYVEDNCDAVELVLLKGKPGEAYNIPGVKEIENLELAKTILRLLCLPQNRCKSVSDRQGHDFRYKISCYKIKRLKFLPGHSFESALKMTIEWYSENQNWWKRRVHP